MCVSELDQGRVDFNKSYALATTDTDLVTAKSGTIQDKKSNDFLFSGTYIDPVTKNPRADYTVALIGLGKKPIISFSRVDHSGKFSFDMENSSEEDHYYLCTISESFEGLSWNDDFYRNITEKPVVYFDSIDIAALNSFVSVAKTRNILHNQYFVKNHKETIPSEQILYDSTRVYPNPDLTYNMSDYIQFDDMEDAIRNILINVHLQKSKNGKHIFIYNNQNPWLNRNPLFLINGIPSHDDSLVLRLNINDIKRIDILDTKLSLTPFGLAGLGGVMAIYTSQKIMPAGCMVTGFTGLHEPKTEYFPVLNDEYPDLSPVVYWNTNVNLSGNSGQVSFRLNDLLSDVKVEVMGFDSLGRIIRSSTVIKISNE